MELEIALWAGVVDLPRNPASALAEFYRQRGIGIDAPSFEQAAIVTRDKWWERAAIPAEVLEFEAAPGNDGVSFNVWFAEHITKQMGDGWAVFYGEGKVSLRDIGNVFKGEEFAMSLGPDANGDFVAGEVYKMGRHFFACTAVCFDGTKINVHMVRTSPPSYLHQPAGLQFASTDA